MLTDRDLCPANNARGPATAGPDRAAGTCGLNHDGAMSRYPFLPNDPSLGRDVTMGLRGMISGSNGSA